MSDLLHTLPDAAERPSLPSTSCLPITPLIPNCHNHHHYPSLPSTGCIPITPLIPNCHNHHCHTAIHQLPFHYHIWNVPSTSSSYSKYSESSSRHLPASSLFLPGESTHRIKVKQMHITTSYQIPHFHFLCSISIWYACNACHILTHNVHLMSDNIPGSLRIWPLCPKKPFWQSWFG